MRSYLCMTIVAILFGAYSASERIKSLDDGQYLATGTGTFSTYEIAN